MLFIPIKMHHLQRALLMPKLLLRTTPLARDSSRMRRIPLFVICPTSLTQPPRITSLRPAPTLNGYHLSLSQILLGHQLHPLCQMQTLLGYQLCPFRRLPSIAGHQLFLLYHAIGYQMFQLCHKGYHPLLLTIRTLWKPSITAFLLLNNKKRVAAVW